MDKGRTNEGASSEIQDKHVGPFPIKLVDCGRDNSPDVRGELLRRVDLAQVAKVVLADEAAQRVAHEVRVELELFEVRLRESAVPLSDFVRVSIR